MQGRARTRAWQASRLSGSRGLTKRKVKLLSYVTNELPALIRDEPSAAERYGIRARSTDATSLLKVASEAPATLYADVVLIAYRRRRSANEITYECLNDSAVRRR